MYCLHGHSQITINQLDRSSEVGFNFTNTTKEGLTAELTFLQPITNGWYASAKVGTNFNQTYSARLGLRYDVLKWKKLNFRMGLDYAITSFDNSAFAAEDEVTHNLEISLDLSHKINDRFTFNTSVGGIIKRFKPEVTSTRSGNSYINSVRLGLSYKF
jgi:hypothetical protein